MVTQPDPLQVGLLNWLTRPDPTASLHRTARRGNTRIIHLLLTNGADINAKYNYGVTALHIAVSYAELAPIDLLLDRGADIHAKDESGSQSLDLAVERGLLCREVFKTIFDQGVLAGSSIEAVSGDMPSQETLEGLWVGTYTILLVSILLVEETSLSISFTPGAPAPLPPVFTWKGQDLTGEFEIYGHLLPGLVIRFVKLYESWGLYYQGIVHQDKMEITGYWGRFREEDECATFVVSKKPPEDRTGRS